ncbi:MAG: hypothetical protein HY699_17000 [Deltaproteobacteria bacterium]|nr:hypothetical protein [Deltaproteobacteria bacterium]
MSGIASRLLVIVIVGALGLVRTDEIAAQTVVYTSDFNGGVGSEWGAPVVDPENPTGQAPTATSPSGEKFLGQLGNAQGRQWATLSLNGLPAHDILRVTFDLYVIGSWDGESTLNGPDYFQVQGGAFLATFSNHAPTAGFGAGEQSFPTPGSPAQTGAAAAGTLGYPLVGEAVVGDTIYHLSVEFPHAGGSLALSFEAGLQQALSDESWGLDNVQVTVERAPNFNGTCPAAIDAGAVPFGGTFLLL